MNERNEHIPLFEEFPPISKEEWEEVIKKDLKGADYTSKLKWNTGEGFELLPFYRREDLEELKHTGPVPSFDKESNEWIICQEIYEREAESANKTAREALERGAGSFQIKLRIHKADGMLGGDIEGTSIQSQHDMSTLLDGIPPETTTLYFDTSMASPAILALLFNEAKSREADPKNVRAALLYDPYAYTMASGQLPKEEADFIDDALNMIRFSEEHLPAVRCLGVDARSYHDAGATIVQELAFALATGSEYLAKLMKQGLSVNEIARNIHFNFAIGSNYFLEIAKIRAARLLWNKVTGAYNHSRADADASTAYVHGETSRWNKTLYDPHTNMLRSSTEGMSAAIAGCDSITVHPFDTTFEQPDEFARRIARNSQVIMKEEAHLDKVADPSAGSYYIETVTDAIAEKAWSLFQEIERQGGMLTAIKNRTVTSLINQTVEERDRAIANRGRIFVGTNQYPDPEHQMKENVTSNLRSTSLRESEHGADIDTKRFIESLAEAFDTGAQLGDVVPSLLDLQKQLIQPIMTYRGPERFEELRLATERHDKTPAVFLVPIGNPRMRSARSTFSRNFFGCAGYKFEDHIGFDSIDEAMKEIRKVKPDIVVLCSSDEEYEEFVPDICKRVSELEHKPIMVLAGYPKENVDAFKEAGIDEFIHAKSNVLVTLAEFHKKLGIVKNS